MHSFLHKKRKRKSVETIWFCGQKFFDTVFASLKYSRAWSIHILSKNGKLAVNDMIGIAKLLKLACIIPRIVLSHVKNESLEPIVLMIWLLRIYISYTFSQKKSRTKRNKDEKKMNRLLRNCYSSSFNCHSLCSFPFSFNRRRFIK